MGTTKIRTYSQLSMYETLEERYNYARLQGQVGLDTFGFYRWMNQSFYTSKQWRDVRNYVVVRDNGCDLGVPEFPIQHMVFIHHLNPMTVEQLVYGDDSVLDPEFLISVSHRTHNAVHFGDETLLPREFVPRRPNDTKLW